MYEGLTPRTTVQIGEILELMGNINSRNQGLTKISAENKNDRTSLRYLNKVHFQVFRVCTKFIILALARVRIPTKQDAACRSIERIVPPLALGRRPEVARALRGEHVSSDARRTTNSVHRDLRRINPENWSWG